MANAKSLPVVRNRAQAMGHRRDRIQARRFASAFMENDLN